MTELFSIMLLAWPNAEMFKGGVAKLGPTIELWTACLPEVDFWTGRQAVVRLCRTSPFPPSIAEFKRQAEAVDREVQTHISLIWNEIRFSPLLDQSPEAWYQSLAPEGIVKAVVDALGGVERFAAGGEGSWNYCEFRDTYKKMICKGSSGAAPQLAPVRTKEMTDL